MNKFLMLIGMAFSFVSLANPITLCGEINKMRIWVNGSDTYGVWVEYINNPSACPGGFYLPQEGNNKDKAYSFLLASKAAKSPICIQTYESAKISNRCKIHYVVDK
jgi:hypothetical protein